MNKFVAVKEDGKLFLMPDDLIKDMFLAGRSDSTKKTEVFSNETLLFDNKNQLVTPTDLRTVTAGDIKMTFYIADYSALIFQLKQSRPENPVTELSGEFTTVVLTHDMCVAFLEKLLCDDAIWRHQENNWYEVYGVSLLTLEKMVADREIN